MLRAALCESAYSLLAECFRPLKDGWLNSCTIPKWLVQGSDTIKKKVNMFLHLSAPLLLACALFAAACAQSVVHQAVPTDSLAPLTASQPRDRDVLAGEWEY